MIARVVVGRHCARTVVVCVTALALTGCAEPVGPIASGLRLVEVSPSEPPPPGVVPEGGQGWQSLSVGRDHVCALDVSGEAFCWGSNAGSQLGADVDSLLCGPPATFCARTPARVRTTLRFQALAAGAAHTCGIALDGSAHCWGSNAKGQLGTPSPRIASSPVPVNSDRRWVMIAAGQDHTCGVADDGALYCWGGNARGQLGTQSFLSYASPQRVRAQTTFTEVAAGADRTCGVAVGGDVYCWGLLWQYTLGNVDFYTAFASPFRIRTDIAARGLTVGVFHACAIEPAGEGMCWGSGQFGQRGDGGVSGSTFPRKVLGARPLRQVSAGSIQSCGVTDDRRAFCWGNNTFGQLGTSVADECMGSSCTTVPVPVDTPMRWIEVRTGLGNHVCGITTLTNLYCWGLGTLGQLGLGERWVGYRSRPELVRPRR